MTARTRKLLRHLVRIMVFILTFAVLLNFFFKKEPALLAVSYAMASYLVFVVSRKVSRVFSPSHFFRHYFNHVQVFASFATVLYLAFVVTMRVVDDLPWLNYFLMILATLCFAVAVSRVFYVGKALKAKIHDDPRDYKDL